MIFADTSFWVALRNVRDTRHGDAVTLIESGRATAIVTTNHVVGETWTFLRRRGGHAAASAFLDGIEQSARTVTERVSADQEEAALRWLRRHDEREYSFVDATSFAFMRSTRLSEALAFDGDFKAAGFVELRP